MRIELGADDSMRERAEKVAQIALCDIVDNASKVNHILPRATLRVLEALELYQKMDREKPKDCGS